MKRKEFDTIKTYLASFETQMTAQFNSLHGRLGEIEKRIANPDSSPYLMTDEAVREIRIKLNGLDRSLSMINDRLGKMEVKDVRSLRMQILDLASELDEN